MSKTYQNKNGHLTELEFVKLINSKELEDFIRHHSVLNDKCPPENLISSDQYCFYCLDCFNHCLSRVKEYKDRYQIGRRKFVKEELYD